MTPYLDETEAQTYFDTVLFTNVWDSATSEERLKALLMATRIIDRLNYFGSKVSESQEHQFPRTDGSNYDSTVPQQIKDACCEIALALLDGVDVNIERENLSVSKSKVKMSRLPTTDHPP